MKYNVDRKDFNEAFNLLLDVVSKWIAEEKIKEQFSHLNTDKVQRIIYKTATYGWYIDDFSKNSTLDLNFCLRVIYGNLPEKLDSYLVAYYDKNLLNIKNRLINRYPNRKIILKEAFNAHSKEMYHSSICLLITQIDGICDDLLDAKFFLNKNYLPEIKEKIESKEIKYSDFLLSPISKKAIINEWEKDLEKYPVRLNRHEIIHGKDVFYGDRINSFKVISMISYIDYILTHFD